MVYHSFLKPLNYKRQNTMANEKKYVVSHLYQEYGGRATMSVLGVFTTPEKARKALENNFHDTCDNLGIEELNALSYQNEDDFRIQTNDELCLAIGTITEVHEDMEFKAYGDEFLETEEENNANPVDKPQRVTSMAELIENIKANIEAGIEPVEISIQYNHGAISRKAITFADEQDANGNDKFEVLNFIDDSTQILSFDELFDEGKTYIGKAIECGAAFYS